MWEDGRTDVRDFPATYADKRVWWDNDLIKHAINRELAREGQIYFVHNRVNDIEQIATRINNIVPEARIRIGHAQMGDDELEQVMIDFVAHKFDILVATTIRRMSR